MSKKPSELLPPEAIKTENITPIKREPESRLKSFRSARDLNLSACAPLARSQRQLPKKKEFVPNLNAVRNKNTDVGIKNEPSNRGRNRNERGRGGRGRGNDRKLSNLVQTHGLFSEGTALTMKNKRTTSEYSRESTSDGLMRPMLLKRELKLDSKEEQKQLIDLLGEEEDDIVIDEKSSDSDSFKPIKLNDPNKRKVIDVSRVKVDKDVNIKLEQVEEFGIDKMEVDLDSTAGSNSSFNGKIKLEPDVDRMADSITSPDSLESLLSSSSTQMFIMQLPDTLPGRAPDIEEDIEGEGSKKMNHCTIRNFEEGLVGKIVRYKSGKTKLVLGEARYDMDLGLNSGFIQELVSVSTNRDERSGSMINLGQIKAKLNVSPDWEYLFHKATS